MVVKNELEILLVQDPENDKMLDVKVECSRKRSTPGSPLSGDCKQPYLAPKSSND